MAPHIAAKLSHETNLAITKLSLSLIHNNIGLGLPMFINTTTRQQISIYSNRPLLIFACLYPHLWKSGVQNLTTVTIGILFVIHTPGNFYDMN